MDLLDRIWREQLGDVICDTLLERGVRVGYVTSMVPGPVRAYARMGGWEAHDGGPASRCLVGVGKTAQEAAMALVDAPASIYHTPNLKSLLWAFGEATELAAGAMAGNRQHEWFKCKQPCEDQHCVYCEGGLAYCVKCKQAECELEDYCRGS